MLKCSEKKISECFTINKICNKLTGRCIKKPEIINEPIVNKINKYRHRQKLAIFDYDWTLVKPKTNGTFSKNVNDWMWLTENVPDIIKKLYDKGYSINIISNQRKNTNKKTQEINNALLNLNLRTVSTNALILFFSPFVLTINISHFNILFLQLPPYFSSS